jgi:hypothetical protein
MNRVFWKKGNSVVCAIYSNDETIKYNCIHRYRLLISDYELEKANGISIIGY